jgi:hypothetical protein
MVIKTNLKVEFYNLGLRVGLNEFALMHKPTMHINVPLNCMIPAVPFIPILKESLRQFVGPDGVSIRKKTRIKTCSQSLESLAD